MTGETLLRLITCPVLYILCVATPRQLAQGLAIRVTIQVVDKDFELPVLKGPEIQIVRRNQRAILRLGFEMQGGNEFIALNDDISRARVVLDEGTEKILIERTQCSCTPDAFFAGQGTDYLRVVSKQRQDAFDITCVHTFKVR